MRREYIIHWNKKKRKKQDFEDFELANSDQKGEDYQSPNSSLWVHLTPTLSLLDADCAIPLTKQVDFLWQGGLRKVWCAMLIGFMQGYEELKWGISKLNPLCNGPAIRPISLDTAREAFLFY